MVSGGGRNIYARAHHPWWPSVCTVGNSVACRFGHHGRLLVHGLDFIRQSGCDVGTRVHYDLRWDRNKPRPSVYHLATGGSGGRHICFGYALSLGSAPVHASVSAGRVMAIVPKRDI